jgi:pimeloyl-ACP methyl ester carboxylesterase
MPRSGASDRFDGVSVYAREVLLVPVGDGRVIEVELAGPPDGLPLFVHHGTPGAAGEFEPLVALAGERNMRHVTYSRPGYGASSRLRGRTVASCVSDVVAIADSLGYERFYSIGSSGGGPHSIACAALVPDRVIAAAAVASLAPFDAPGLDWTAGMGKENIEEVAAACAGERELGQYLEREVQRIQEASPDQLAEAFGELVSDADRRTLNGALAEHVVRHATRTFAQGVCGWVDDDRALFTGWGFELERIGAPLSIWHGGQDRYVPIAHGEWLAARTNARAHLRPEDGHLSLEIGSYGEILDALLAG